MINIIFERMEKKKRVLVCPMDWGLGHATRDVPVIRLLLEAGAEVIIGADNKPLQFLRKRFPQLRWVKMEGYRPEYQKRGPLVLKIAAELPKMMAETMPVRKKLEQIIKQYDIDAVVSDNRYELWSEQVPTVFMTHQLNIELRGMLAPAKGVVRKVLYSFIEKHNEVWIPDVEGEPNLSGILSHVKQFPEVPHYFVGPLSRFEFVKKGDEKTAAVDLLCIMSGPEPQRTILEKRLTDKLKNMDYKTVLLSAKPDKAERRTVGNVQVLSHADDAAMASLLRNTGLVISRSGYTTVMDLAVFGTKALFIPTPGQPEQEYLAKRFREKGQYYSVEQSAPHLEQAVEKAMEYPGIKMNNDYLLLRQRIASLLEKI